MKQVVKLLIVVLFANCCLSVSAGVTAEKILESSGVTGGLIVHVGCGDGKMTVKFRAGDNFLVQGLDTDRKKIDIARKHIQSLGIYGKVTAGLFDGIHLPYIENAVNLLVADEAGKLSKDEIMRVLVPGGLAIINGKKMIKPRPDQMDDWPHFLHGANGNAVADDTIVDTPYHMQWAGGPRYARTHEGVSTVNVAVSDGKRLYYIADDATEALPHQIPSEWTLIARDAFNGIVLWKRPLERWQARSDGSRHNYPPDLFRRLVAGQQHVYATLDILGPAAALDPATGKTIHVYKDSEGTEEILYDDGVLYLVVNTTPTEKIDRGLLATKIPASQPKRIMAFDAKTARLLWSRQGVDTVGLVTMSTAVKDGNLVYQNADNVICLDAATGEIRWQTERLTPTIRPVWGTTTLVIADDVVLSADRKVGKAKDINKKKLEKAKSAEKMEILALSNNASELIAYDLKTGKELWKTATEEGSHIPNELFVVDGLVWAGEKSSRSQQDYQLGRDIHTGEVKVTIPDSDAWTSEHHHRCYRDKATSRFILAGRTGVEFIDLRAGDIASHHWIRGICKFGVLPCNGLIYIPPNQCSCYQESLLNGFNALAPKSRTMDIDFPTKAEKLEKGPAYGKIENRKSKKANPSDWATYRYDAARSGSTLERVSKSLKQAWQTKISAPITAPVVAAGRVYVAAKDRHMLYALDSRSGDIKWSYIAGGRIDSPPTIADGYAVFGCRDGYVYAIRAEDGVLVWRYQAAPADRQLVAHGQCESVWPVHGSVLIEDGRVYFAAGRYSHLDGGVICSIVDLETGKKIEEQRHYSRQPGTGGQKSLYEPFDGALLPGRELPGVSPDVPSSDGKFVFMRSVAYDRAFKPADEYVQHLFSSTGFLDDAWYQRLFWIYGNHMFSGLSGRGFNKKYTSAGRMLVEDIDMVFGYRDYTLEGEGVFAIEKTSTLGVFDSQFPPAKQTKDKFKEKIPAERWHLDVPFYVRAMIGADSSLILAGPPKYEPEAAHEEIGSLGLDTIPPSPLLQKALDAWRGKLGGKLWIVNKKDGTRQAELELASPPVHDGIAVANGKLYICGMDGSIRCLEGK